MIINKQVQLMQSRTVTAPVKTNYPIQRTIEHHKKAPDIPNVETWMRIQRIVIVGSSGAGKSTLARDLGQKLNLPVIHLDKHYWNPGWVGTPASIWQEKMAALTCGEQWIIDGNYRETLNVRLQAADTVVFLDLPRLVCATRAIKRRIQYRNKPRPDMAPGCQETLFKPDFPQFLVRIWDYPNRAKPDVEEQLIDLAPSKRIIHLKSRNETAQFLSDPIQFATRIQPMSLVGNSRI